MKTGKGKKKKKLSVCHNIVIRIICSQMFGFVFGDLLLRGKKGGIPQTRARSVTDPGSG